MTKNDTNYDENEKNFSPRAAAREKQRSELARINYGLSDEEIDFILHGLANERISLAEAGHGKQTWSRYLVENYLSKVRAIFYIIKTGDWR